MSARSSSSSAKGPVSGVTAAQASARFPVQPSSSRSTMPSPRALIAEDEQILRQELVELLARLWPELGIVAQAGDGVAALRALDESHPDVMFLDIQMPGLSGLEVA